jgi:NADPH2:quinone reductase
VDAVIELDFAANARLMPAVLRPRGTIVVNGTGDAESQIPTQWFLVNAIALKFIYAYELTAEERAAAIAGITRMIADKLLVNNVALTLPLAEVVAAHEAVEQGKAVGNVVLRL